MIIALSSTRLPLRSCVYTSRQHFLFTVFCFQYKLYYFKKVFCWRNLFPKKLLMFARRLLHIDTSECWIRCWIEKRNDFIIVFFFSSFKHYVIFKLRINWMHYYYRIYQFDRYEVFSNSTSNWQTRYVRNTNDFQFSPLWRLFRDTFAGVIRVDNTTIEMYFLIYFPLYSIKGDEKSIVETFDI